MLAAGIEEHKEFYENNPLLPPQRLQTDEEKRKEDILYYMLDFYAKLLRGDIKAKSEINYLDESFFESPLDLAIRFGSNIYLGVLHTILKLNDRQLSGVGKKAYNLLNKLPKDLLQGRNEYLKTLKKT